jgi:hypothetical protein
MKKYKLSFILLLAYITGYSQTYNQGLNLIYLTTDSVEAYYKENSNIVKYRAYKINSTTTSSKLWFSDNDFSSSILINDFTYDTSINIFRWAIADKMYPIGQPRHCPFLSAE